MPHSNIEPENIRIDKIETGIATIRVRWNIVETLKETEDGHPYSDWAYEERRMTWTLPEPFASIGEIQTYLDARYDAGDPSDGQILSWAKASKVSL